jgi:hypothetical protein
MQSVKYGSYLRRILCRKRCIKAESCCGASDLKKIEKNKIFFEKGVAKSGKVWYYIKAVARREQDMVR